MDDAVISQGTNLCIVYGECIGRSERTMGRAPCHFRDVITGGVMTILQTHSRKRALDFERKHFVFEAATSKCSSIESCLDTVKETMNKHDDTKSNLDMIRSVQQILNNEHEAHHLRCVRLCKNARSVKQTRERLLQKIKFMRKKKTNVTCILVTGSVGEIIVKDSQFRETLRELGVHVIQSCRHPTSALYDAEKAVSFDRTYLSA